MTSRTHAVRCPQVDRPGWDPRPRVALPLDVTATSSRERSHVAPTRASRVMARHDARRRRDGSGDRAAVRAELELAGRGAHRLTTHIDQDDVAVVRRAIGD